MQQAGRAAGVQEQPDCQSQPRQTSAAGALPHFGSKWHLNESLPSLFPSSPLNQGAFKACTRVSELQVFTHTAEVKVDPDKPLEGVRLAVLQVALSERLFHTCQNLGPSFTFEILQKSLRESLHVPHCM